MIGIKSIITNVVNWVTNPKNLKFLLLGLCIAMFLLVLHFRNEAKHFERQSKIHQNNIAALQDTLETYKDENGYMNAQRLALVSDLSNLKSLNSKLRDKVQEQQDKLDLNVISGDLSLTSDTVFVDSTESARIDSNKYKLDWSHRNSGDWGESIVSGYNTFSISPELDIFNSNTVITQNTTDLNVTTGFREITEGPDKGKIEVYMRSDHPNVEFNNLQGAILNPDKYFEGKVERSRWSIGPSIGYGLNTDLELKPTLNISLQYSVIRF